MLGACDRMVTFWSFPAAPTVCASRLANSVTIDVEVSVLFSPNLVTRDHTGTKRLSAFRAHLHVSSSQASAAYDPLLGSLLAFGLHLW
jgi:hypothetical protein